MLKMLLVLCFLLLAAWTTVYSQTPPQTPVVKAKEQAQNTSEVNKNPHPSTSNIPSPASVSLQPQPDIDAENPHDNAQHASEEASEFWPPFFGYRIKVTDSFVVVFTCVLSVATVLLYYATKKLAVISWKQEESTRIIERAYVKMSHWPPGLERIFHSNQFDVKLKIKNFGETPATVTSVVLTNTIVARDGLLPTIPEYPTDQDARRVFLVRGDEFRISYTVVILSPDFKRLQDGEQYLCVYGYVDYIDQFRTRHRAGYARRYDPRGPILGEGSNLNYITQPNYNYDRKRKKDEGNDWNESI